MADFPRCASCRVRIEPGQNVVFRPDGRVQHSVCPELACRVCARSVRPQDPIRRDGHGLVHSNCWIRLHRAVLKPAAAIASDTPGGIRSVIRSKLAAGTLSLDRVGKVWVRLGKGDACSACEQPINTGQTEHEIDGLGGATFVFHRNCLDLWQSEVTKCGPEIGGGSAASPWTVFFDVRIARRAARDRAMHQALLAASAESCAMAATTRARSARTRARTTKLLRTA